MGDEDVMNETLQQIAKAINLLECELRDNDHGSVPSLINKLCEAIPMKGENAETSARLPYTTLVHAQSVLRQYVEARAASES